MKKKAEMLFRDKKDGKTYFDFSHLVYVRIRRQLRPWQSLLVVVSAAHNQHFQPRRTTEAKNGILRAALNPDVTLPPPDYRCN